MKQKLVYCDHCFELFLLFISAIFKILSCQSESSPTQKEINKNINEMTRDLGRNFHIHNTHMFKEITPPKINDFELNNGKPWYIDSRCHSHWHIIIIDGVVCYKKKVWYVSFFHLKKIILVSFFFSQ